MPTYEIMLAHDVSVYGHVEVEADTLAEAVEQIRADLDGEGKLWDNVSDVDYSTSYNFRVVLVETGDDNLIDGVRVSEPDSEVPLSAEQVLASITAQHISK